MPQQAATGELERQLRGEEGSSRWVYRDSRGLDSIGIGRLCDHRVPSSGLEDWEQSWLFNNDCVRTLKEAEQFLPWIHELDQTRKDAILNMCFQMGAAGVAKFTRSMAFIRAKEWQLAAQNLAQSSWRQQTPERAIRVIDQIRTGVYQYKPGF